MIDSHSLTEISNEGTVPHSKNSMLVVCRHIRTQYPAFEEVRAATVPSLSSVFPERLEWGFNSHAVTGFRFASSQTLRTFQICKSRSIAFVKGVDGLRIGREVRDRK